jgi:hypothetical protein
MASGQGPVRPLVRSRLGVPSYNVLIRSLVAILGFLVLVLA